MAERNRTTLKSYFETGDAPTQTQFSDLIDSFLSLVDDTIAIADVVGLSTALNAKQATLVSGTNIKTVNGESLLGSGNIEIVGGGGDMEKATYDPNNIEGDTFDMENMSEAADAKILTATVRTKLSEIQEGAQVNSVTSVNSKTGAVALTQDDIASGSSYKQTENNYSTSERNVALKTFSRKILIETQGDDESADITITLPFISGTTSSDIWPMLDLKIGMGDADDFGIGEFSHIIFEATNSPTIIANEATQILSNISSVSGGYTVIIRAPLNGAGGQGYGNYYEFLGQILDPANVIDLENVSVVVDSTSETPPTEAPLTFNKKTAFDAKVDQDVRTAASPSFVSVNINGKSVTYNGNKYAIEYVSGLGPTVTIGQSLYLLYYNNTGSAIQAGSVLHLTGAETVNDTNYPTPELADASDWEKTQGTITIAANSASNGEFILSTRFGMIDGVDTSSVTAGSQLWLSADGSGAFTETKPEFPNYSISVGGAFNSLVGGKIFVNITKDIYDTILDAWDGGFRETINFTVSSDGTTITGSLENVDSSKDLTMLFGDGFNNLDTTPAATVTLTPGTDTNPQENYIYVPKDTKVLTSSISGWPSSEHIKVADVLVQSASGVQANDALVNRNWNDHIKKEGNNGHILHLAERLRQNHAEWYSGAEGTCSVIGGNSATVQVTGGSVYQLHKQTFPSFDTSGSDSFYVVNHNSTPYLKENDIYNLANDANGDALLNTSYSVVLMGVQNKTGDASQLLLTLPSGTYSKNVPENAANDLSNYAVYDVPKAFKGKVFLIAKFNFVNSSGTLSLYSTEDLRGKIPNASAGGGSGGSGASTFPGLLDTPSSYVDQAGKVPVVNDGEDGLEFFALKKRFSWAALTSAVTQTIDVSVNQNALCNVELLGDPTFLLSNLTEPCSGIIDLTELTTQRAVTLLAEDDSSTAIDVKSIKGTSILTVAGATTSITWEYNGSWVNVTFSDYQ